MEYDKELFTPLNDDEKKIEEVVRPSISYWQDAWRRLKKNKLAIVSLIFIVLFTLTVVILTTFSSLDYSSNNLLMTNQKPSASHIFGTDHLGRDIFIRIMYGAKYSLIIGFSAALINVVIGVLYGGISGFFGGRIDNIMMRIVDIIYSIPLIIIVILLMTYFYANKASNDSGLSSIILALSISYWLSMARIVRGEILQLKEREFVLAAKALGASKKRILLRHLIPNCLGPIIVTTTLLIPQAIFTEAFLSYIGLGLNPPKASLGTLCNEAMQGLYVFPYQMFFPAIVICLIILAFNLFGDGLRDALDPKMKR